MAEKVSQDSVHYRRANPQAMRKCGTCEMFRPKKPGGSVGACTLVEGVIEAPMVCDRWAPKKDDKNGY